MATFFNSWISHSSDVVFRGTTAPDSSKYYACLIDDSVTISRTSSLIAVIAGEVPKINGYDRNNISFLAGTYDTLEQRYEYPNIDLSWSASGGSYDFRSLVIIADGKAIAPRAFTNANIDTGTDVITINAHGFTSGDKVIFAKATGATLPSGVAELTEYTVASATTNTLQLTGVNFATAGSGTFYLKSVDGQLVAWHSEPANVTILDGQTQPFTIPTAHFNAGYTTGV